MTGNAICEDGHVYQVQLSGRDQGKADKNRISGRRIWCWNPLPQPYNEESTRRVELEGLVKGAWAMLIRIVSCFDPDTTRAYVKIIMV